VELLTNPIRRYAWGSRTAIAAIQGRLPSGEPEAELWIGAHPADPSRLAAGALDAVISADPAGTLGTRVRRAYGDRLPFLAKILAAAEPVSLQVHPDPDQARAGFEAEERRGVPPGAPERRYLDPYAKPEMTIAIEQFEAMSGFRPAAESAELLRRLLVDAPALAGPLAALEAGDLAAATAEVLTTADPKGLVHGVGIGARRLADRDPAYDRAAELAERYPGDSGVALTLLLRLLRLAPGQGLYLPAGAPHTYLSGVAIEAMSASDNTLRAGLTPKHVDVPEVLRLLRFTDEPALIVDPTPVPGAGPRLVYWPTPAAEFELYRAEPTGPALDLPDVDGPAVLLCVHGSVDLVGRAGGVGRADGAVRVPSGEAAWLPAAAGPVSIAGTGTAFLVAVPC
jgi:mannose-6-phosphate isomerase